MSSVLLDGGKGMMLRSLLIVGVISCFILVMPLLEYILGRILVSAPFWGQWMTWGRIARSRFPLKLLLGQLVWKGVANAFGKLEGEVRDWIVDWECEILEESVPITVGVGAEDEEEEDAVECGEEDVDEEVVEFEEEEEEVTFSEDEQIEDDYDEDE